MIRNVGGSHAVGGLRRRSILAAGSASLAFPAIAQRQEPAIRLIVPYTPGTVGDLGARAIAPKLAERLARPIIVDNRAGASGTIGTEAVVRAAPDGSTLMMSPNTLVISAPLFPSLPYDPVRDLTPISQTHAVRLVVAAHKSTGFASVRDLVAAARKAPGRINYGSPGVGTPNHLVMEMLKLNAGVFLTHIPYRGTAPQLADLLGGQVETGALSVQAAVPNIRNGRLAGLGIASATWHPLLPDLPTLAEAGVPNVNGDIWFGLFGPRGMAPELVAKLNREVREILAPGPVRTGLEQQGVEVETSSPEEFSRLVQADAKRYGDLIRRQNIRAE